MQNKLLKVQCKYFNKSFLVYKLMDPIWHNGHGICEIILQKIFIWSVRKNDLYFHGTHKKIKIIIHWR